MKMTLRLAATTILIGFLFSKKGSFSFVDWLVVSFWLAILLRVLSLVL